MFVITRKNKDLYQSGCRVETFEDFEDALSNLNPEDGLFKLEETGKKLEQADDSVDEILFTDDTSVKRLDLNVHDAIEHILDLNMYDTSNISEYEVQAFKDGDMSNKQEAEFLLKLAPDAKVVYRSSIEELKENMKILGAKLFKLIQE